MSLESLVANGISELQSTRYASLAASTIIVYDHLMTFDQEIELIWKARWSTVKFLFFVNRYYNLCSVVYNNYVLFATSLTDSVCLRWFQWQGVTGIIACLIAEVILQLRLYALYLHNKKVLAFMVICFLTSSACAAVIMGTVMSRVTAVSQLIPGMHFCIPLGVSPDFYIFWLPIIAFETLLGVLALVRGVQTVRSDHGLMRVGRDLINILIRDSVLYFLIIFATYLSNVVVWSTQSEYLVELPIFFAAAMSCVMGNRIILNIRGVKWELVSFSRDSAPMSPINFRQQETTSEDATFEQRSVLAEAV